MNITFHDDLSTFCVINEMPAYSDWKEVAEFLDVKYYNGGAKDAVMLYLKPDSKPTKPTKPQPQAPAAPPAVSTDDLFKLFAARVNEHITAPNIDESKVIDLINKYSKPYTKETVITINNEVKGTLPGRQHFAFDELALIMSSNVNIYLYGDAGTGKSQLAKNIALALGKKFYSISISSQTPESKFFGSLTVTGETKRTQFREAYEHGGVYLIDECDNGNANTLTSLNGALAGDSCAFVDGMVNRHPDFKCIATANTFGSGATRQFVGRNQLDDAFLDRFVQYEIPYDEELEREVWGDIALKVQDLRRKLKGERVILSMRKMINTQDLINRGMKPERAFEIAVINTIPFNLRSRIK